MTRYGDANPRHKSLLLDLVDSDLSSDHGKILKNQDLEEMRSRPDQKQSQKAYVLYAWAGTAVDGAIGSAGVVNSLTDEQPTAIYVKAIIMEEGKSPIVDLCKVKLPNDTGFDPDKDWSKINSETIPTFVSFDEKIVGEGLPLERELVEVGYELRYDKSAGESGIYYGRGHKGGRILKYDCREEKSAKKALDDRKGKEKPPPDETPESPPEEGEPPPPPPPRTENDNLMFSPETRGDSALLLGDSGMQGSWGTAIGERLVELGWNVLPENAHKSGNSGKIARKPTTQIGSGIRAWTRDNCKKNKKHPNWGDAGFNCIRSYLESSNPPKVVYITLGGNSGTGADATKLIDKIRGATGADTPIVWFLGQPAGIGSKGQDKRYLNESGPAPRGRITRYKEIKTAIQNIKNVTVIDSQIEDPEFNPGTNCIPGKKCSNAEHSDGLHIKLAAVRRLMQNVSSGTIPAK